MIFTLCGYALLLMVLLYYFYCKSFDLLDIYLELLHTTANTIYQGNASQNPQWKFVTFRSKYHQNGSRFIINILDI